MEVIVCLTTLVIITVIILVSLTDSPSEQRSRIEAKYFDQDVAIRQDLDLEDSNKQVELRYAQLQKGLIDNEFEDVS